MTTKKPLTRVLRVITLDELAHVYDRSTYHSNIFGPQTFQFLLNFEVLMLSSFKVNKNPVQIILIVGLFINFIYLAISVARTIFESLFIAPFLMKIHRLH